MDENFIFNSEIKKVEKKNSILEEDEEIQNEGENIEV